MAEKLPQEWTQYNSKVVSVDYKAKQITYINKDNDGLEQTVNYDVLVNTAPIDILINETKICPQLNIEHNQVTVCNRQSFHYLYIYPGFHCWCWT